MSMTVALVALPAQVDLRIYQGDHFSFDLTVTDNAGNPADLTGVTVVAGVAASPGAAILAAFTATVAANVITLALPSDASAALIGRGVWDCQITDHAGNVTTLAAGLVIVTPGVSS